jgi:hypothetical protein
MHTTVVTGRIEDILLVLVVQVVVVVVFGIWFL